MTIVRQTDWQTDGFLRIFIVKKSGVRLDQNDKQSKVINYSCEGWFWLFAADNKILQDKNNSNNNKTKD